MILKRITKWINKFKKYFFYYRDGFFEFPYLCNSPELMVQSLIGMPFNKHNKELQTIYSKNPFLEGVLHYHEIEKGLWIMMVDMNYKTNLCFKAIFEEEDVEDYYMLTYFISNTALNKLSTSMVNDITFSTKTWLFFKPNQQVDAYSFKNTQAIHFNVYMSKEWITKNTSANKASLPVQKLLNSDLKSISISDLKDPDTTNPFLSLYNTINGKNEKGGINNLQLKIEVLKFIADFYTAMGTIVISEVQPQLNSENRKLVQKAERILLDNLFVVFPGIENMAEELGISPTKLKSDFKQVYGQTLFQYYQQHRMHYAKETLTNQKIKIQDIAKNLGYETVSKFSAAYKKQFGYSPSDTNNQQ
jgi:AraC-like DNA-binding protein